MGIELIALRVLACSVLFGAVFGKLREPSRTQATLNRLGFSARGATVAFWGLLVVELAGAVAIAVTPGRVAGCIVFFGFLLLALAYAKVKRVSGDCGCGLHLLDRARDEKLAVALRLGLAAPGLIIATVEPLKSPPLDVTLWILVGAGIAGIAGATGASPFSSSAPSTLLADRPPGDPSALGAASDASRRRFLGWVTAAVFGPWLVRGTTAWATVGGGTEGNCAALEAGCIHCCEKELEECIRSVRPLECVAQQIKCLAACSTCYFRCELFYTPICTIPNSYCWGIKFP